MNLNSDANCDAKLLFLIVNGCSRRGPNLKRFCRDGETKAGKKRKNMPVWPDMCRS